MTERILNRFFSGDEPILREIEFHRSCTGECKEGNRGGYRVYVTDVYFDLDYNAYGRLEFRVTDRKKQYRGQQERDFKFRNFPLTPPDFKTFLKLLDLRLIPHGCRLNRDIAQEIFYPTYEWFQLQKLQVKEEMEKIDEVGGRE